MGLSGDIDGLDPAFFNALNQLGSVCNIRVGSGFRTREEQADLYRRKPGLAAPPGKSNHETGMAADIEGDLDCAHANAAQFGLRFPMDYEPWHIEPGDLDRSNTQDPPPPQQPDPIADLVSVVFGDQVAARAFSPDPDEIEADEQQAKTRVGAGLDAATDQAGAATQGGVDAANPAAPQTGANYNAGNRLSPVQLAQVYANAGFTGEKLVEMVATAMGESGGDPGAHNPKGEDSRGISQINMDAHADKFSGWDLYDPQQNANAAFIVSGNGTNLGPWTVYTSGKYQQFMDEARAAVAQIGGAVAAPTAPAEAPTPEQPEDLASALDVSGLTQPTKLEDSRTML